MMKSQRGGIEGDTRIEHGKKKQELMKLLNKMKESIII